MISVNDVKHISKLAKLEMSDSEIKKFGPQLNKILEYVDKLKKVDTSNVIATSHVISEIKSRFQDEKSEQKHLSQDNALRNASKIKDGYFVTKAVIEK